MKKILFFFPDNVGKQTAGNKTRAIYLLKYFKQKGFKVDFVSLKHEKTDQHTEQETIDLLKKNSLADDVFLLPRKPRKGNLLAYFIRYKIRDLCYHWLTYPIRSNIPAFLTIRLKQAFEHILKNNNYDYVIISYVQCAGLVSNKKLLKNAKTIVDTHDFITAQFKDKRRFNLGVTFEDEINRLGHFDEIWAISMAEQYIFNQFCKSQVRLVPLMLDIPDIKLKPFNERKYDLIYVASDNIHNINSSKWFFEEVYPLLPPDINMCVVGKINNYIDEKHKIERITFAEDLNQYYNNARVVICPMLTGTGVKVKVIEALAFGLPVVCTPRGVDGLPDKHQNGCMVSDDPAIFTQNIEALLNDKALYDLQSKFARALFDSSFSKEIIFEELDRAFEINVS